jgi:oligopeptide/dipeptide ABC transporter ATP-binding protein
MNPAASLLSIENLRVSFPGPHGTAHAVNGTSFAVAAGERVGVVGESGSGKSVTALAVMGLLKGAIVEGRAVFRRTDLVRLSNRRMRQLRGSQIAMIFQNPLHCLNPAMTIGAQIEEPMVTHLGVSKADARARAVKLLDRVGIPAPDRNMGEYPHRFSGGMRQRVMIAMALSCEPALLIADEPTTALDVTIQAQIIELLAEVCAERGTAVILITHDLGVLAGFAERIVVMYAGRVVEEGMIDTVFYGADHPYTWGLMTSITRMDEARQERLLPISGNPPSAVRVPQGCAFHPRCPFARDVCSSEVPDLMMRPRTNHVSACHFAGQIPAPKGLREKGGE